MEKETAGNVQLMGIVNVNGDSFCDDGSLDPGEMAAKAVSLINQGADIIDVGAESARTNRDAISVEEEIRRFKLFLSQWAEIVEGAEPRDGLQTWPPKLSLNTWRSEVIEEILPLGGDILNDMSGLASVKNAELAHLNDVQLLIMHIVGEPKIPHGYQEWEDVLGAVMDFFRQKIKMATDAGLAKQSLILDPGIDFAKQSKHNLKLYAYTDEICSLGCKVLLPISRKTVIGEVLGVAEPSQRDAGTLACMVNGMLCGAGIFRVHNVNAAYQAARMIRAVIIH